MARPVLVIEHRSGVAPDGVGRLLASDAGLALEYANWDAHLVERVRGSRARLVVAVPDGERAPALHFFDWVRRAVDVSMFAVLPECADCELTRSAIDAADDFALAPVRVEELCHRVRRLLGPEDGTVAAVRDRLTRELGLSQLVGTEPAFVRVVEQLPRIARGDAPVLITGETGTGKELCARAIHYLSRRRPKPFVALDCAAVPDHLFENELFGHVRGAFTDAHRDQRGVVDIANGGTLFLDEVDTLSPAAQAKLLRFLQEGSFKPLGGDRFVAADVNLVAATNADLEARVREKLFRADLYFRLNVIRLHLPPLRDRRGDIAVLATHFLHEECRARDVSRRAFAPSALQKLARYDWPGNVRELVNVVRRAALLTEGRQILAAHVSLPVEEPEAATPEETFRAARAGAIETFERRYVVEMLRRHGGNVTRAAREAQKDRRAFGRLIKKYRIDRLDTIALPSAGGSKSGSQ